MVHICLDQQEGMEPEGVPIVTIIMSPYAIYNVESFLKLVQLHGSVTFTKLMDVLRWIRSNDHTVPEVVV